MAYDDIKRINGSYGELEIDGNKIWEVKSLNTSITINREDVTQSGSRSVGTKITSVKGTGSFTVDKINSRFNGLYLQQIIGSGDPRFLMRASINDKDNRGREEIVIKNCKFDGDFNLMNYELGSLVEQEFNFVFKPEDVIISSLI